MKKLFRFALAIIAMSSMVIACQEDPEDPNGGNDTPEEKTGWEGDWGVIGDFNGWGGDVEMVAANDGWYVAEEVEIPEGGTLEFKFRRDKTWGDYEYGIETAGEIELDKEIALKEKGANLKAPKAGVYKMEIQPNKELAKIHFVKDAEPAFTPAITIDGNFDDWANIAGLEAAVGNHAEFKVTSDARYVYFYSRRANTGRYSDIWDGNGYIYFALDLDKDDTTGDGTLWGNGPYEFVGVVFPYGGSAEAPAIDVDVVNTDAACAPDIYTIDNLVLNGAIDEGGATIEFSIPRADIPEIPNAEIIVKAWGNKDLDKVSVTVTL